MLAAVVLTAVAQLLLKAGAKNSPPRPFRFPAPLPLRCASRASRACLQEWPVYFISMLLWIMALTRMEVSVAYPMLSLGYVLTAIAAYFLFGEDVGVQRMIGIVIIIVGVVITARS